MPAVPPVVPTTSMPANESVALPAGSANLRAEPSASARLLSAFAHLIGGILARQGQNSGSRTPEPAAEQPAQSGPAETPTPTAGDAQAKAAVDAQAPPAIPNLPETPGPAPQVRPEPSRSRTPRSDDAHPTRSPEPAMPVVPPMAAALSLTASLPAPSGPAETPIALPTEPAAQQPEAARAIHELPLAQPAAVPMEETPLHLPAHAAVPVMPPPSDPVPASQEPQIPLMQPLAMGAVHPQSEASATQALPQTPGQPLPASPGAQVAPALIALVHPADGGARGVVLSLHPAELGHVQIQLFQSAGQGTRIEIAADRPETLALLVRDQPQLHHALDQAGVPLDGRTLTFHLTPTAHAAPAPAAPSAAAGGHASFGESGGQRGGQQNQPRHSLPQGRLQTGTEPPDSLGWLRFGLNITA